MKKSFIYQPLPQMNRNMNIFTYILNFISNHKKLIKTNIPIVDIYNTIFYFISEEYQHLLEKTSKPIFKFNTQDSYIILSENLFVINQINPIEIIPYIDQPTPLSNTFKKIYNYHYSRHLKTNMLNRDTS
jgi:hypothetical protein